MLRHPLCTLLLALPLHTCVALAQPAAPAAAQPVVEQAPLPARTARTVASLATEEQNRLTKWIQSALSALEAPPSDNAKAVAALQEGEGLLTGQSADVIEAWGAYGMLGRRLNNADAQSKALNNLMALGADRSQVQGLRDLVAVLQASAPKPAPVTAPSATPAPAAQPQPTPAQPAEDPALARRTARKALLDGLKALPRDDANRASLDALTAMVERAAAADRTLTRVQERTLVLIVQQLEQAADETVKTEKQAELVTALANALATAPENPRHWALLIQVAKDMPDDQTLTLDLGEQHKFTATGGMLVRGGVACLELLGAENSEDNAVVDGLVAGRLAVTAAERAAAQRAVAAAAAAAEAERAAAEQRRLAAIQQRWAGDWSGSKSHKFFGDSTATVTMTASFRIISQSTVDTAIALRGTGTGADGSFSHSFTLNGNIPGKSSEVTTSSRDYINQYQPEKYFKIRTDQENVVSSQNMEFSGDFIRVDYTMKVHVSHSDTNDPTFRQEFSKFGSYLFDMSDKGDALHVRHFVNDGSDVISSEEIRKRVQPEFTLRRVTK